MDGNAFDGRMKRRHVVKIRVSFSLIVFRLIETFGIEIALVYIENPPNSEIYLGSSLFKPPRLVSVILEVCSQKTPFSPHKTTAKKKTHV
ncbi:hypothetical protein TNCT_615221 [Trichonephila clavata]|uniref:Uncharacterized protein n=1 Tax=Trichonephila clavata TaxID=2740835 RepID=A0A8X6HUE1_TRICU|nr:hypothetical protein TNCT_615221 [Trichonephila clavata]